MRSSTEREGNPRPSRSLSKNLRLFFLGLLTLAISSMFVLPPDATHVMGYSSSEPASKSGGCTYQVRPGDNLYRIGLRYGVYCQYLAALNGIYNPHSIAAGSVLSVPCGASSQPDVPSTLCGPSQTYVVNHGDNLFRIALDHGSTVELLRAANNLYGRVLFAGMNLALPCPESAGKPPLPLAPATETVGTPSAPTASETPAPPAITPQVTSLSPVVAVTPAITIVATPLVTPAAGTPINPAVAPVVVTTPGPVTLNIAISMRGNKFVKDVVEIGVGNRVTWVNDETDGTVHTVTCGECPANFTFDSGSNPIGPGQSYSVLFTTPGVYFYNSRLQQNMSGMIIVNPKAP